MRNIQYLTHYHAVDKLICYLLGVNQEIEKCYYENLPRRI
jgi:hypothetical protein